MAAPASIFIDDTKISFAMGSLQVDGRIEERSVASFTVVDTAGSGSYTKGQKIEIYSGNIGSPSGTPLFAGFIESVDIQRIAPSGGLWHNVQCIDNTYLADKRLIAKVYTNDTAADMVNDVITSYLTDEGISAGTIDTGLTFTRVVANYVSASDFIQSLADACGFTWYIDVAKALHFIDRSTNAAPWTITAAKMLESSPVKLLSGNQQYRNRQYHRGGIAETSEQTQNFTGDGVLTSFSLGYPLNRVPTITEDAAAQTVGIKGVDTGKDYYWSKGDPVVYAATAPANGVDVEVVYYGQFKVISLVFDSAEVTAQKALDGGTGFVESVLYNADVESKAESFELASAQITKYCQNAQKLTFTTRDSGLQAGQLAPVTYAPFGFTAYEMLIESVVIRDTPAELNYDVTAVTGPVLGSWTQLFKSLASRDPVIKLGEDEQIVILLQQKENLALSEATAYHNDATPAARWIALPPDQGAGCHVNHEALTLTEAPDGTAHETENYVWG